MFVDLPAYWPDDPKPERPKRRISARGEKVLIGLLGFNMVLLVVAPVGGVTLIHWLIAVLAR
ncbi:conserved protein of unknown function [Bradyrhizobium sp. ORS 285]|uniref:hypothetical protein n=1 Tax=Bradyrhizobium sp. ORS 285 TaxID=115808 RepID=UPI0002406779|nr:hypothetical protein [Bradyrhizobium sp. ORS 285]CCD86052.1 conserved hypothetical protein [Bradyrhizobium sp. ORS 285]SMX61360.1 conserved protein of unknown function [Bradyrhizobium sp. ORS 285]